MYKYNNSDCFNIKNRPLNYTLKKTKCIKLEKEIFSFINDIRKNPSKIIEIFEKIHNNPNHNGNCETHQILNYINIFIENNISLPPLIENKELSKISYELLTYLINIKKYKGIINYNNLEEEYINLRMRASPYGRIRGKYYEAIVLDTTNLEEILYYIMKDTKGRNILFNKKIKYIGIACGYFDNINIGNNFHNSNNNKICTIIDMVQDFELNTQENYDIYYDNSSKKIYRNKTPEIFTRIKTIFKDKNYNNYNINKNERDNESKGRNKKYYILTKDNFIDNKSCDSKIISINKASLLKSNNKITPTFPSQFYLGKFNTSNANDTFASLKTKIKNKKLSSFKDLKVNYHNNNNKNNTLYYSSQNNLNKINGIKKKNLYLNFSEKKESNSGSFSRRKSSKKKLKQEEKIELLKQINKASRDKTSKKNKKNSNIKNEDDSKSISLKSKKNISNDLSFSELISIENKDEKEMKINLKNQIKKEIKNEIEKEIKEELKAELVNNLLSSVNRKYKKKLPILQLPLNNNINYDTSYDNGNLNKTSPKEFKNTEINTNRSISSIDILLPNNKNISTINNNNSTINYNSKDNIIIKKLVKLYNNVINKHERSENYFDKNNSFNNKKNNIYYKNPTLNKTFYYNRKNQNNFYNNEQNTNKKITNKIIKLNNNQNLINSRLNSPNERSKIMQLPFKKIIVKNQNNIKKILKIEQKPIKDVNYIDGKNIIINNKTNNIVYIKQISPNKNIYFKG